MFNREEDYEAMQREEERMRRIRQREMEEDEFDDVDEDWLRREPENTFLCFGGEA